MSTVTLHLKWLKLFEDQLRFPVSTFTLYFLFISLYNSFLPVAAKGNSNHLLKNSAKRRRSKAQIAEDKEREAKRSTIDQERIDEIAALKQTIERITVEAARASKNEDALLGLIKEGKVAANDMNELEVVYDETE